MKTEGERDYLLPPPYRIILTAVGPSQHQHRPWQIRFSPTRNTVHAGEAKMGCKLLLTPSYTLWILVRLRLRASTVQTTTPVQQVVGERMISRVLSNPCNEQSWRLQ